MRWFFYTWRTLAIFTGLVLTCAAVILTFLTVYDFQPKAIEELPVKGMARIKADPSQEINLITWNIGYAGLGRETDFFYDGGKMVRPEIQHYQSYLNGIYNTLSHADTVDFLLIQEADQEAKRSYYVNQPELLSDNLPDYIFSYALNYNVQFIPFPIHNPMGKVKAGLLSFSRFKASEALRYSAPANFSWPKRIFFLDRCFLLMRFPLTGGKNLVVINLHQSAWQEGAALRKSETRLLEETIMKEYQLGNYVIAGGDWNQPPPDYIPMRFSTGDKLKDYGNQQGDTLLTPDWKFIYDAALPSNRDVNSAYRKGITPTSVIDYYLVSPNIEVKEVRTLNNGFAFSDHHPVYMRVKLIADSLLVKPPIPRAQ